MLYDKRKVFIFMPEPDEFHRKKYELCMKRVELAQKSQIKEGCAVFAEDHDADIISSHDSKQEALEELKKYRSSAFYRPWTGHGFWVVTEYFIQEVEYDENGDDISDGIEVWKIAEMTE